MLWKKLKVLGLGSYGTVSLAAPMNVDSSSTIFAAVKSAEVARSSSLQEEGKILQALRGSEYVVECFGEDVSVENGKYTYNLMLEYAAGGTLHDLICKSNMSLRESEAAYYAFQLLEGISHVHNKGFIHCDLKPANILVFPPTEKYMRLKLADFGLSLKSTETHDGDSSKKHPNHHRGTLAYASPESVTSEIYAKDVDIWALGCIVIEMIAGRRVWSGYKSNYELALKIAHEEPEIPYNITKDAKDFLSKCLERDHNQRWTAEMLLNHTFIIKNVNIKKMDDDDDDVLIQKCNWISTEHLFSTISNYYPDHNSSRGSSSNISSSESTNSSKAKHTTDDEDSVLGIWDLINLLFA
ncbi:hypothetical protein KY290_034247 [Solanum tuberosum]|uniref:Protein kinase domain-containing protein n=1 Tax=Solanum tuberosum TaxID=4113 RepID=A0ABQ7U2P8_SOLTU|nr:hypothetical protein KY290_034247 [Solanum tuberosum]